jgi:hypothetical protein
MTNNEPVTGAIHSANFLPWLGTFDKIFRVQKFIIFDIVQYPLGKNWGSRVKILLNGKEHWLTMPIKKSGNSGQKEYEVEMLEPQYNWNKMCATIRQAYLKAPHFKEAFEFITLECTVGDTQLLNDFNLNFMMKLTRKLGNNTVQFLRSSENEKLRNSLNLRTELIVETCLAYNINRYLSGEGCLDFLLPDQFVKNNIELKFQQFKHPVYKQLNVDHFVPGLSIIDALMNCGFEELRQILKATY